MRSVHNFATKMGYGTGFWTLLVGVLIAGAILVQLEASQKKMHDQTQVERIPASELDFSH